MSNYITPAIIRETNAGLERCQIQDIMLQHREVECVGEITLELVNSLILQLRFLQREDPEKEIAMYVNSNGGSVTDGLALYDAMQVLSCPIRTVCVGMAASMGAVLFASGHTREIFPHGRVMIHDPLLSGGISGSALKIHRTAKDLMEMRELMAKILSKHTKQKLPTVYEKTAVDSYFNASEAVEFGLADKIVDKL